MRINIIPPETLSDQHLVAEYREIKMVPRVLYARLHSRREIIPEELESFTMNRGHGIFFYNKLLFLEKRMESIVIEMNRRGFQTNHKHLITQEEILDKLKSRDNLWNDWTPSREEKDTLIERILLRLSQKKNPDSDIVNFYTHFGEKYTLDWWKTLMETETLPE